MTTTKENLANPGPVGLCGFALTTWLLSLINGGFFTAPEGVGLVLGMALAFGGIAQVIAGMFEFKKGNTFGFYRFYQLWRLLVDMGFVYHLFQR